MDRVPHEFPGARHGHGDRPRPGRGFPVLHNAPSPAIGIDREAANQLDGSVQVIAEGDREAVDSLLEWLQSRDAPPRKTRGCHLHASHRRVLRILGGLKHSNLRPAFAL